MDSAYPSTASLLRLPTEIRHQIINDLLPSPDPSKHQNLTPHAPLAPDTLSDLLHALTTLAHVSPLFAADILHLLSSPSSTLHAMSLAAQKGVAAVEATYRERVALYDETVRTGRGGVMREFSERLDVLEYKSRWRLVWEARRAEGERWEELRALVEYVVKMEGEVQRCGR